MLLFNILVCFSFFFMEAHCVELDASLTNKPGYFESIWNIAKFYLGNRWNKKEHHEETPNLNNNYSYLIEKRTQNNMGKMTSFFDPNFQTRIYYSATAKPNQSGEIDVIDNNSKAVVIYFHGSGTENGSGANFNYKGNKLASLGYSSLSLDYPFHKDGPINSKYGNAKFYMSYLNEFIQQHRITGKPVILVGHSFGVNIIAELITRYPFAADSVVMLSPGGFNEELAVWAREKTTPMLRTFPHFVYNELGSRWAGFINRGFIWNKTKNRSFKDPTLVNPNLKVRILSGEWEEFIPGPLDLNGLPAKEPRTYDVLAEMKKFFSRATTVLEAKVGHLVHSHIDDQGNDLVIREILAANGESASDSKEISDNISKERKKILSELDQAIQKQLIEPFFREWLTETYQLDFLTKLLKNPDPVYSTKIARRVISDFKKFEEYRLDSILLYLKETQSEFYFLNQSQIDKTISNKNLNERTQIINQYFNYLSANPDKQKSDNVKGNIIKQWIEESSWSLAERIIIEVKSNEVIKANKPTQLSKQSQPKDHKQCLLHYIAI